MVRYSTLARAASAVARTARRGGRRKGCCSIAKKALRVANSLKKMKLKKYLDSNEIDNTIVANTAEMRLLNGMTNGTSANQHEQDLVKLVSVSCKGCWYGGAVNEPMVARLMIVYDRSSDGVAPGITDILQTQSVYSLYNVQQERGRFQFLYDRTWNLLPTTATMTAQKPFKLYRKINRKASYQMANAGTIIDLKFGSLWYVYITTGNSGSAALSTVWRLQFVDD